MQIEWVFDDTSFGWDLFVVVTGWGGTHQTKNSIILSRNGFQLCYVRENIYMHKISKFTLAIPLLNATVYEKFHIVNASMERRQRDRVMLLGFGKLKKWTSDRYFLGLFTADLRIKWRHDK